MNAPIKLFLLTLAMLTRIAALPTPQDGEIVQKPCLRLTY